MAEVGDYCADVVGPEWYGCAEVVVCNDLAVVCTDEVCGEGDVDGAVVWALCCAEGA